MPAKALAKTSSAPANYTPDQIELIKSTIAVGATDNELSLFLQVCKNHKLDPFTRQIHFVKRGGKGAIQTGIDGFRAIAERTGCYAGNDDAVFDNEEKPTKATVTVWKMVTGVRCPFTAAARWSQYCPTGGQDFMWKKMPHVMLGKCAEALALRKAFPESLSGLYSDDEMAQAGKPDMEPVPAPVKAQVIDAAAVSAPAQQPAQDKQSDHVHPDGSPVVPDESPHATANQISEIAALCKELGGTVQALYKHGGIKGRPTKKQAENMLKALRLTTGRAAEPDHAVTEADVEAAENAAKAA